MDDQPPLDVSPAVSDTRSQGLDAQSLDAQSLDRGASRHFARSDPSDLQPLGYAPAAAWAWLSGSVLILLLASILSIGPARRIYLPGVSLPLPETCMLHARFGLDCPGCGLTRSFIHFAHGRLVEGMSLNPAGIAIFLFVAAQVPAAACRFAFGRTSRFAILWSRCNEIAIVVLPTLTFIQWIVRLSIGDLP